MKIENIDYKKWDALRRKCVFYERGKCFHQWGTACPKQKDGEEKIKQTCPVISKQTTGKECD